MQEKYSVIDQLNKELKMIDHFDNNDVYNAFEKFVSNKSGLISLIEFGGLHYEYVRFSLVYKDTLFEDAIELILCMFNQAYVKNKEECIKVLENHYQSIVNGLASHMQNAWGQISRKESGRSDLFVKESFKLVGDLIENTIKPYIFLFDDLRAVNRGKVPKRNKFGVAVNNLITVEETFKGIYCDLILGIKISDWRNIADHGGYFYQDKDNITIQYGENKITTRNITIKELEMLLYVIDLITYVHKTAFTLIEIDHMEDIAEVSKSLIKTCNSLKDDVLCQIAETSYAFNMELRDIDWEEKYVEVEIKGNNMTKDHLVKYISCIFSLVEKDFKIFFYNNGKVQYNSVFNNNQIEIYKFKI